MDAPVRRVVFQQIAALARDQRIYVGAEIDEAAWLRLLIERMAESEPVAHQDVLHESANDFYANCIREYIRKTRDPAMDDVRDIRASMRRAAEQNTIVKFQIEGKHIAKRYLDLTPGEALARAAEYRKQGGALLRKAAQYEADANRAIQLGLALDKPFSTLFTEADLQGSDEEEAAG